jgi:uncharacterized protein
MNNDSGMYHLTEVLSRDACLPYLESASLGRIGISISSTPAILPVNFKLHNDAILIRTQKGSKLDAAVHGAMVAFEVDGFDEGRGAAWSVLVQGISSEVVGNDELVNAQSAELDSWAVDDQVDHFIRIELTNVSGRRITRSE